MFGALKEYAGDLARQSTDMGQGLIDAAKTGGALGVARNVVGNIRSGYQALGIPPPEVAEAYKQGGLQGVAGAAGNFLRQSARDVAQTVAPPVAGVLAGPQAEQKTAQFLSQTPAAPVTPEQKANSDAQKQTPKPAQTMAPDINNVQKGYGVMQFSNKPNNQGHLSGTGGFDESTHEGVQNYVQGLKARGVSYNIGPDGNVSKSDGSAMRGTVSYLQDDQTAATADKEAAHAQGMARLRAGLPYDAAEFAAWQQAQQQGRLADMAMNPKLDNVSRQSASNIYGANAKSASDAKAAAIEAQKFGVNAALEMAKLNKPQINTTSVDVQDFDANGQPIANRKTGVPSTHKEARSFANGQMQQDPSLLSRAQQIAKAQANYDINNRGILDRIFSEAPDADALAMDKLRSVAPQFGITIDPATGRPMKFVP